MSSATHPSTLLAHERDGRASLEADLALLLCGSKDVLRKREEAFLLVTRDKVLNNLAEVDDYSGQEARANTMARIKRIFELGSQVDRTDAAAAKVFMQVVLGYDATLWMRMGVHSGLFHDTIETLGTDEQYNELKDDIRSGRVIGCFAMTELGHSSDLPGLETTVTYNPKKETLTLHSPNTTSTKWWIGMAGHTATHAVVLCQLYSLGQAHGLVWVLVPLRDRLTGAFMPGVTCGDVGAKMGREGIDNGWMQFTNVNLPRSALLSRYVSVAVDGTVTREGDPRIAYSTLITERISLVAATLFPLSACLTVAVRYAFARVQGARDEQLMYYQSHQVKLMPALALVYGTNLVEKRLSAMNNAMKAARAAGDATAGERVKELHLLTSGLKAWITWWSCEGMDACRQSLGGHGYSRYNAVGGHLCDSWVLTTGGGDNIVMAQQCAKILLGSLHKSMSGRVSSLLPSVALFARASEILAAAPVVGGGSEPVVWLCERCEVGGCGGAVCSDRDRNSTTSTTTTTTSSSSSSSSNNNNNEKNPCTCDAAAATHCALLEWLVVYSTKAGGEAVVAGGADRHAAWNGAMMDVVAASANFAALYVWECLDSAACVVETTDNSSYENAACTAAALRCMADVWALHSIVRSLATVLEGGGVVPGAAVGLRRAYYRACERLSKISVVSVDAFRIPDTVLRAPLGCYDGDIYETYLERVKAQPNACVVPPYFNESILPLTGQQLRAKL